MIAKIIISVVLYLIVILSGIWLIKTGHPYNSIVFNVHKLIALAAIVLSFIIVNTMRKNQPLDSEYNWIYLAGIVFAVAAIISGGLLNVQNLHGKLLSVLHKITPILTLLIYGALLILFKKQA